MSLTVSNRTQTFTRVHSVSVGGVAVGCAKSMGTPECRGPQFQAKNKSNLTDLQILGCELHNTEFAGRGQAAATALSQTP